MPISAIRFREIADDRPAEQSSSIRERVTRARSIQQERFRSEGIFASAHMTARAYNGVLKVAHTIADIEGSGGL